MLPCARLIRIIRPEHMRAKYSGGPNLRAALARGTATSISPTTLIVLMTMQIGAAILAEAGLSFLGVGIQPPASAWGYMVSDGRNYLYTNPILSFAPGLAIMFAVFAFNMVGDGLRDALDPRLRGVL